MNEIVEEKAKQLEIEATEREQTMADLNKEKKAAGPIQKNGDGPRAKND